ncbi:Endonuclease exonuclease phosphatase domain-containing [Micractinium conductrix]|uniref:Endonuclease exonuclease phosphatase domain-containing n=1 Tax=Micractinium conductrix TaxID=554055 RepID=A0A2P6VEG9_9CHLO|nr:Endonuclease exonuclease phosphatase domain-containing [Micractinium conductrix]|eukprot:PSC72469.1 Endonuclease exonuclease phosphatase domain-containing [Micractinium conductrix]
MMASELPPPGAVLRRDFRCGPTQVPARLDGAIKLLQWNIERGYQLAGIIEELRSIDADIISLQEVDVGCERSGGADTGVAIAQALGLNYAFLCEFEEEYSPLRDARSQGGGVHGNTILSKFDFLESAVVPHRSHPVDWNNPTHALARREPRRGERAVLRAVVDAPQGPLVVYSAHLEVFCGLLARITQLADIFADARLQADRGLHRQAILGDMNTMAHGIARLSPNYCCDHMRLRSIGMDEAAVWHRHVLPVLDLHPFPPTTTTLDNPAYRWFGLSLMKGKLDWVLLRRLRAVTTQVGNHSYALSDHKWLAAEVVPE